MVDNEKLANLRRTVRRLEKQQRRKYKGEKAMNLRDEMLAKLPPELLPGNVGDLSQVRWNYDFPIQFAIPVGQTTFGQATRLVQYFQVPQEGALILTHMALGYESLAGSVDTPAGAPLHVEIRDRQSSRQFMSAPLSIGAIGSGKYPTALPAKMIFMPAAFVDFTLTSFADGTYNYTTKTGYLNFVCYGVRIRVKDAKDVLGTVFS